VRRMIVNDFISWRRKWARIVPLADVPQAEVVADHADRHADQAALVPRLAALPPRQRAVIVLRYYAGLNDAEIAGELGCGVSTVRSNMSRALAALRVRMGESAYARTGRD
jgi:RNA polymerase sigma factor (sigma-70 family)